MARARAGAAAPRRLPAAGTRAAARGEPRASWFVPFSFSRRKVSSHVPPQSSRFVICSVQWPPRERVPLGVECALSSPDPSETSCVPGSDQPGDRVYIIKLFSDNAGSADILPSLMPPSGCSWLGPWRRSAGARMLQGWAACRCPEPPGPQGSLGWVATWRKRQVVRSRTDTAALGPGGPGRGCWARRGCWPL